MQTFTFLSTSSRQQQICRILESSCSSTDKKCWNGNDESPVERLLRGVQHVSQPFAASRQYWCDGTWPRTARCDKCFCSSCILWTLFDSGIVPWHCSLCAVGRVVRKPFFIADARAASFVQRGERMQELQSENQRCIGVLCAGEQRLLRSCSAVCVHLGQFARRPDQRRTGVGFCGVSLQGQLHWTGGFHA